MAFKTLIVVFEACCACVLVTLIASLLATRRAPAQQLDTNTRSLLTADYSAERVLPRLPSFEPSIVKAAAEDEKRLARTEVRIGEYSPSSPSSSGGGGLTIKPASTAEGGPAPRLEATQTPGSVAKAPSGPQGTPANREPVNSLTPISCNLKSLQRSVQSTTPARIRIENRSAKTVDIYWLNLFGDAIYRDTLNPGQQVELDTFLTHPWLVTDTAGVCINVFTSNATLSTAVIR